MDFQVETSAFTSWQHLVTFHHTFPNWRFDIPTELLQVFFARVSQQWAPTGVFGWNMPVECVIHHRVTSL